MITRIWTAHATPEGAVRYRRHFETAVLPDLRSTAGFEAAYLLTREAGDGFEIQVLTLWASLEAIRAFATAGLDVAVVEPSAIEAVEAYDRTVRHFATEAYGR